LRETGEGGEEGVEGFEVLRRVVVAGDEGRRRWTVEPVARRRRRLARSNVLLTPVSCW